MGEVTVTSNVLFRDILDSNCLGSIRRVGIKIKILFLVFALLSRCVIDLGISLTSAILGQVTFFATGERMPLTFLLLNRNKNLIYEDFTFP